MLSSILPGVKLFVYPDRDDKTIIGFLGVSEEKIEMLFIHPDKRGQGIGSLLNEFAVKQLHTCKGDVNEQNEQALGFYKKLGYRVVGRTEVDSLGKPSDTTNGIREINYADYFFFSSPMLRILGLVRD